jgi:hypothetical protein
MRKCTPGNLIGHGDMLWEVRCLRALRCIQVMLVLYLLC